MIFYNFYLFILDLGKYTSACYNQPPFLKIKTCAEGISLLSSCNSNIYSSVIIFLTVNTPNIYENFFKCMSKVVGCELRHLSIECDDYDISADAGPPNVLPKELHDNVSWKKKWFYNNNKAIFAYVFLFLEIK